MVLINKEEIKTKVDEESEDNSIIIRLEKFSDENSYFNLKRHSDMVGEYYAEKLKERINTLINAYNEPLSQSEKKEIDDYLDFIKFLAKPNFTPDEKEMIFNLYKKSLDELYGPQEFYQDKVFLDEDYTLKGVLHDTDILSRIIQTLPKIMKKPRLIEIKEKLNALRTELSKIYKNKAIHQLAVNREYFFDNYAKIISLLSKLKAKGENFNLILDEDGMKFEPNTFESRTPYSYTDEEIDLLFTFEEKNIAKRIYFSEFHLQNFMPFSEKDVWSFDDVADANIVKLDLVEMANDFNLSPFEFVLMANLEIDEGEYLGTADKTEKTRTYLTSFGASQDDETRSQMLKDGKGYVCTGKASFGKALIDDLKNENLKAKFLPTNYYNKKTREQQYLSTHMLLLVYIKDEKYNIDGYYIWDPTWSSGLLNFTLIPVSDINHYTKIYSSTEHNKNYSSVTKFLIQPREKEISEGQTFNHDLDEFADKSKPISVKTYVDGIKNLFETMNKNGRLFGDSDESIVCEPEVVEEFLKEYLDDTVQEIGLLDLKTADFDFNAELKKFYESHSKEFPNWKKEWPTLNIKRTFDDLEKQK